MAEQWQDDVKRAFEASISKSGVKLREHGPMQLPVPTERALDLMVETPRAQEAPEPREEEQPQDEPQEAPEEQQEEEASEEAQETESDEPQDEPEEPREDEALKKAKRYLKLKVNPPDGTLDGDPDEILEWAARVRENEADIERWKAERASSRRGEEATNGEQEPAPELDFARLLEPFWEGLGLDGGDRAAQAFLRALQAGNSELAARVERAEESLRQREISDMERVLDRQRKRLAKTVPHLGRSLPAWRAVLGAAAEIAQRRQVPDDKALDMAVQALYDIKVERKRGPLSPKTPQRPAVEQARTVSKPPSKGEWDRRIFDVIQARAKRGQRTSPGEAYSAAKAYFGSAPAQTRGA
jgi:hypothetical protein